MLDLILSEYERSLSLYQKGHLITGRNIKDLSLENVWPHIVLVGNFIPKGVAVQLPLNNR